MRWRKACGAPVPGRLRGSACLARNNWRPRLFVEFVGAFAAGNAVKDKHDAKAIAAMAAVFERIEISPLLFYVFCNTNETCAER